MISIYLKHLIFDRFLDSVFGNMIRQFVPDYTRKTLQLNHIYDMIISEYGCSPIHRITMVGATVINITPLYIYSNKKYIEI